MHEKLSSRHDMVTDLMNSHQLWLTAPNMSNVKPDTVPASVREELVRAYS